MPPSVALGPRPWSASLDTSRKVPRGRGTKEALTADIIARAWAEHGRWGCCKITTLLHAAGWVVNARVERIRRREGLKGPRRPRTGRPWLADGSCIRLKPKHRHVWVCRVVEKRTHDGRQVRMLDVVNEFTRKCLAIRVARKLKAADVDRRPV
jgi:hypothetical protein